MVAVERGRSQPPALLDDTAAADRRGDRSRQQHRRQYREQRLMARVLQRHRNSATMSAARIGAIANGRVSVRPISIRRASSIVPGWLKSCGRHSLIRDRFSVADQPERQDERFDAIGIDERRRERGEAEQSPAARRRETRAGRGFDQRLERERPDQQRGRR